MMTRAAPVLASLRSLDKSLLVFNAKILQTLDAECHALFGGWREPW